MIDIPKGYCQCGCGMKTKPHRDNNQFRGEIKGEPRKYCKGHNSKGKPRWKGGEVTCPRGYVRILKPEHPRAHNHTGYVYKHILMCEKALGKSLPLKAEAHHINGIKNDNRNCNLILCEDRAFHLLLHKRTKTLKACGHADWEKCSFCKVWGPKDTMITYNGTRHFHKICRNEYQNQRYKSK